jgi:biopolymer transport protein ExbD
MISINHDGSVYLAGDRLDVSQLTLRLKALGGNEPVIISAESTADYRRIAEVMDACKAAAVYQITLATATTR